MGIDIVAVIPNRKNRTREDIDETFGVVKIMDGFTFNWEIFEWEGESYASWIITPRYVDLN